MSQSTDVLPGLRLALDLARNQLAHHRRQAACEDNPERYEDDCAGHGVERLVVKIEAAIDEAKRQQRAYPASVADGGW